MLAKFLKRKESRHVIQQPQSQEVPEKSAEKNGIQNQQITTQPLVQYRYQRPDLLGKVKQFMYNNYTCILKEFHWKSTDKIFLLNISLRVFFIYLRIISSFSLLISQKRARVAVEFFIFKLTFFF